MPHFELDIIQSTHSLVDVEWRTDWCAPLARWMDVFGFGPKAQPFFTLQHF